MQNAKLVKNDIYWVGGNDRRIALFENVYPIPRGVSYNAYVVMDEKTVLLDTVDKAVSGVFFENLEHVLNGRKLDYVIVNHMEPDHAATLGELVLRHPEVRIVCQENAYRQVITGAVGGAAGVIHAVDCPTTDCQPNDNVEALRVALDKANIEARPLWKPMHRQPVYRNAPAYTNGVSESLFHRGLCLPAGPYVTDEDVRYIASTIAAAIVER